MTATLSLMLTRLPTVKLGCCKGYHKLDVVMATLSLMLCLSEKPGGKIMGEEAW